MAGETLPAAVFSQLSEIDAWAAIRTWSEVSDPVLSDLASGLMSRRLYGSREQNFSSEEELDRVRSAEREILDGLSDEERYLFVVDVAEDVPYRPYLPGEPGGAIRIRDRNGGIFAIEDRSALVETLARASYQFRRWCYHRSLEDRVEAVSSKWIGKRA